MPEYFDISLIISRIETNSQELDELLYKSFGLTDDQSKNNLHRFFANKKILLTYFQFEDIDYDEVLISFEDQKFHPNDFEKELKPFTDFMNFCFKNCSDIKFGLCGFELNGYLLSDIKLIRDLNTECLNRFPITYARILDSPYPQIAINLESQHIWYH